MQTKATTVALPHVIRTNLYIVLSVVALIVTLAGFSATYIIPMAGGTFVSRPMVHIHGALYFTWLLLFIAQPVLIRNRQMKLHRQLGVAGFILAGVMVIMGLAVAVTGAKLNAVAMTTSGLPARQFLLIPITDMILFASFIGLSLVNLKRGDVHKRLMVLATSAVLPAAFGRLFPMLGITSVPLLILLVETLVVIAIAHELITRRKVHKVYLWGGGIMLLVHAVRFPLAATDWWISVSNWILQ